MIYKEIDSIDSQNILDFYYSIENQIEWLDDGAKSKQSGLQYLPIPKFDPYLIGTGTGKFTEKVFTKLIEIYQNTICEHIIKKYNLTRTRWMWVYPYACYSIHIDSSPRIHIPLITNPDNLFLFPEDNFTVHLKENKVYWVNTTYRHTFINCSNQFRLHLVGSTSSGV